MLGALVLGVTAFLLGGGKCPLAGTIDLVAAFFAKFVGPTRWGAAFGAIALVGTASLLSVPARAQAGYHDQITITISDEFTGVSGAPCFNVSWSYTASDTSSHILSASLRRYLVGPPPGPKETIHELPTVFNFDVDETHSTYGDPIPYQTVNVSPPVEDCPPHGKYVIYEVEAAFNLPIVPGVPESVYQSLFGSPKTSNQVRTRPVPASPPASMTLEFGLLRNILSWSKVPDGGGLTINGYRIWRAPRADVAELDWELLHTAKSSDETSYIHGNLVRGVEHYYQLSTVTSEGGSPRSTAVGGRVLSAADFLDLNGVDQVNGNDTRILYLAYGFRELLGTGAGDGSGFADIRQAMLGELSGMELSPEDGLADEQLRAFLSKANDLIRNVDALEFDVNGSGAVTQDDALILHYAHTMATELGDGQGGGTADFRHTFLRPLAVSRDPSDAELRMLLERANVLLGN